MLQQIIGVSLSEPHIDKIARVFVVGGLSSLILHHDKYGILILPVVFTCKTVIAQVRVSLSRRVFLQERLARRQEAYTTQYNHKRSYQEHNKLMTQDSVIKFHDFSSMAISKCDTCQERFPNLSFMTQANGINEYIRCVISNCIYIAALVLAQARPLMFYIVLVMFIIKAKKKIIAQKKHCCNIGMKYYFYFHYFYIVAILPVPAISILTLFYRQWEIQVRESSYVVRNGGFVFFQKKRPHTNVGWNPTCPPTNVVSFIDILIEYHLWVVINLLIHLAMLDLSMRNALLAK